MTEFIEMAGKRAAVLAGDAPQIMLFLCVGPDPGNMLMEIFSRHPLPDEAALVFPLEADWDCDYTPWPSRELAGRTFTGGGETFYHETVLPLCCSAQARFSSIEHWGILGYSLGGLFALYAASRCDSPFERAASVSGALWYEGFADYAAQSPFPALKRAYLSLGRREAGRGRGPMGRVGEATQRVDQVLRARLGDENVCFEWNNGGHFFEVSQRIERAISEICKL